MLNPEAFNAPQNTTEKRRPRSGGRRQRRRAPQIDTKISIESANVDVVVVDDDDECGSVKTERAEKIHETESIGSVKPLAQSGGGPAQDSEQELGAFPPSMTLQCDDKPKANRSKNCEDTEALRVVNNAPQSQEEVFVASSNVVSQTIDEECHTLRSQPEVSPSPSRKPRRRRPVSLDFNGQGAETSALSPCFFGGGSLRMNKNSIGSSGIHSGSFPSPVLPNYQPNSGGLYVKEWSSERVPHLTNSRRRYRGSGGGFVPFNSGRTLPSKWEDAEKWIFSPVSVDGMGRPLVPYAHVRRPKSKSGPLGPLSGNPRAYSAASPVDSGKAGKFITCSPFLAGVLIPEHECCANGDDGRAGDGNRGDVERMGCYAGDGDSYIDRSASIQEWSETLVESSCSMTSSRDEKVEGNIEDSAITSPLALRDAATQMSPERSCPRDALSSTSPYASQEATSEPQESQSSKFHVRDVQVDDRVTFTRWSKKHIARGFDKSSVKIVEWKKKKTVESEDCLWELSGAKSMSKYMREEAKITAWENLQKAKAEADIRKLEMKLEKKRASSMDKIINKLMSAQKKAQEMRDAVNSKKTNQFMNSKRKSYSYKGGQMSGCFACPAF